MRYVTIGRHPYTPRQQELLLKAGLLREAARIENLENPRQPVELAREKAATAIVVQALPLHLLAQLLQEARKAGIEVYSFKMRSEKLAKEDKCPPGTEIELASGDTKRCIRTEALQRIENILIVTETVAE